MSDCNVCIVGGEPDGYCQVFERTTIKKSRKTFKCCECGREIPIGSSYESTFTVFEGDAERWKACSDCVDIRDTFHCDGETQPIIGHLWESIAESDFFRQLTTGCIAKLKTVEAKKYLQERWMQWKGLVK